MPKLSDIAAAGSPPSATDFVVGVTSGATDQRYSFQQVSAGIAGGSSGYIQYKNSSGFLAGDANLIWYPSGTSSPGGATVGGVANLLHAAFGDDAQLHGNSVLWLEESFSGDLAFGPMGGVVEGISCFPSYVHTGGSNAAVRGIDSQPSIEASSTGPISEAGHYFEVLNHGSGNVGGLFGLETKVSHYGSGTTNLTGLGSSCNLFAGGFVAESYEFIGEGTNVDGHIGLRCAMRLYPWFKNSVGTVVDDNYGIIIEDHSGNDPASALATGDNFNIWSKGSLSVNVFDGWLAIGDGITAPATMTGYASIYVDTSDGDLKVKFGDGTVKTIVVDT